MQSSILNEFEMILCELDKLILESTKLIENGTLNQFTVEEAIDMLGFGKFQLKLIAICGLFSVMTWVFCGYVLIFHTIVMCLGNRCLRNDAAFSFVSRTQM